MLFLHLTICKPWKQTFFTFHFCMWLRSSRVTSNLWEWRSERVTSSLLTTSLPPNHLDATFSPAVFNDCLSVWLHSCWVMFLPSVCLSVCTPVCLSRVRVSRAYSVCTYLYNYVSIIFLFLMLPSINPELPSWMFVPVCHSGGASLYITEPPSNQVTNTINSMQKCFTDIIIIETKTSYWRKAIVDEGKTCNKHRND